MPYTPDDVAVLYSLIGEGVWHLQHLENVVGSYTALRMLESEREAGFTITQENADRVLGAQRRLTLGALISAARGRGTIPVSLEARFDAFLNERNWLIHRCVIEEFLALRGEAAKHRLFGRLKRFRDEAIELTRQINLLLEEWYVSKGYDLALAHQLAGTQLRDAEQR